MKKYVPVEIEIGTPSLKHPAKTIRARASKAEAWESRGAMQDKADETERLRAKAKARRGVTVVGD